MFSISTNLPTLV